MAADKTHHGYTLEEIFWWIKRLGKNVSLHTEAGEYRMVFSHRTCGTQELYGSIWSVAKSAVEALATAIGSADRIDLEAFACEFPESVSA